MSQKSSKTPKLRNWIAVHTHFRKAGAHSSKTELDEEEDVEERLSELSENEVKL